MIEISFVNPTNHPYPLLAEGGETPPPRQGGDRGGLTG